MAPARWVAAKRPGRLAQGKARHVPSHCFGKGRTTQKPTTQKEALSPSGFAFHPQPFWSTPTCCRALAFFPAFWLALSFFRRRTDACRAGAYFLYVKERCVFVFPWSYFVQAFLPSLSALPRGRLLRACRFGATGLSPIQPNSSPPFGFGCSVLFLYYSKYVY